MEGESGKRSAAQRAASLAHAPGKETCSVIPSLAWKWGLHAGMCTRVRRTDTTKRRSTQKRSWPRLTPLSFCKCGICFPALSTTAAADSYRFGRTRGGFPAFPEKNLKLKVA